MSRSRAREVAAESSRSEAGGQSEPQLVKVPSEQATTPDGSAKPENDAVAPAVWLSESASAEGALIEAQQVVRNNPLNVLPDADGAPKSGDTDTHGETSSQSVYVSGRPDSAESRRTLHLSLSQDAAHRSNMQRQDSPLGVHSSASGTSTINRSAGVPQPASPQPDRGRSADYTLPANSGSLPIVREPQRAKDAATFIDQALRERVDSDITIFLAAFDAALAADTPESRAELRDATDRLLRAGARTRIQLERLEARVPLPPRDGHNDTAWRAR